MLLIGANIYLNNCNKSLIINLDLLYILFILIILFGFVVKQSHSPNFLFNFLFNLHASIVKRSGFK